MVFWLCKVSRVCNDDVEVPSQKVTRIHLQKPHPLPCPQYCVVKGNELYSVIYIELLRLQIFQLEKMKEPGTSLHYAHLTLRIVDIQA